MSNVTIVIDTDNAAFDDGNSGYELARILRMLANAYEDGYAEDKRLLDVNGNTVGQAVWTK